MQGPATREELFTHVLGCLPGAYPGSPTARERAFKRDRENLRRHLQAQVVYNPRNNTYLLQDAGPYAALRLSGRSHRALRLLSQTFTQPHGEHLDVIHLVQELLRRMPEADRRQLEAQSIGLSMDLDLHVESGQISERVWQCVNQALQEQRVILFSYLPLSSAEDKPRRYKVAPLEIVYRNGHFYLKAMALSSQTEQDAPRHFRLSAIIDDDTLVVSPSRAAPVTLRAPRYEVHYRLLLPLARRVSRRFEDMRATPLKDGSIEVRGWTDNPFEAARVLLSYGEHCIVLGGDEVLRRWRVAVEGMSRNLAGASPLAGGWTADEG